MQQILTVEIDNNSSLGNSFCFGSANVSQPFANRSVVSEALLLFLVSEVQLRKSFHSVVQLSIDTNEVHLDIQIQ